MVFALQRHGATETQSTSRKEKTGGMIIGNGCRCALSVVGVLVLSQHWNHGKTELIYVQKATVFIVMSILYRGVYLSKFPIFSKNHSL
jgi:hypothetical protein